MCHNNAKSMGARRHGQEGALAPLLKCCKVFCALVVTAKRSVYLLFMHYFTTCHRRGHRGPTDPTPLGEFRPETSNLPTPGKIPAGAHGEKKVEQASHLMEIWITLNVANGKYSSVKLAIKIEGHKSVSPSARCACHRGL